jgi:PAS domain S-box-containing protein
MRIFDRTDPRSIDRRQWEPWVLALTVVFVLAVGTALLMYSTAISNDLIVSAKTNPKIFISFCALSVLLVGYVLERQVAVSRLCERLADERNRAEEALGESEARFRAIFENAAIGIALVDVRGHPVETNAAIQQMLGYTKFELADKVFTEYTHPDDARADWDLFIGLVKGKRDQYQIEKRFVRKDGQVVWGQVNVSLVRNQKGEFEYCIGMVEDISERKRTADALRELSGRLLRLQDEERRHIARELHDTTAQSLAAMAINLNVVKDSVAELNPRARACLSESLELAKQCSREIRTLSYLLHPPLLDEVGLGSALPWFVSGYAQRTGIHVDLEMPPTLTRLPGDIELALYRIVQEGLTNIHLHSGSKRAHICLRFRPSQAVLIVADEGHGIPPGVLERGWRRDEKLGIGISGMRERIRQLGGKFEVLSGSNGTTLTAVVMLREEQA